MVVRGRAATNARFDGLNAGRERGLLNAGHWRLPFHLWRDGGRVDRILKRPGNRRRYSAWRRPLRDDEERPLILDRGRPLSLMRALHPVDGVSAQPGPRCYSIYRGGREEKHLMILWSWKHLC